MQTKIISTELSSRTDQHIKTKRWILDHCRAVFFDSDGVLTTETHALHYRAYQEAFLEATGVNVTVEAIDAVQSNQPLRAELYNLLKSISVLANKYPHETQFDSYAELLKHKDDYSEFIELIERLRELKESKTKELFASHTFKPVVQAKALIRFLKGKRINVFVVSSDANTRHVQESMGLLPEFVEIVTGADAGSTKEGIVLQSKLDFIRYLQQKHGLDPRQAMLVEDSATTIGKAKKAQLIGYGLGIASRGQAITPFRVAQADDVFSSVEELYKLLVSEDSRG